MYLNVTHLNRRRQRAVRSSLALVVAIALVLTESVLFCRPVWATSYECVDRSGNVIYTDSPAPIEKCNVIELLTAASPQTGGVIPRTQGIAEPDFGRPDPPPPAVVPYDAAGDEPYPQQEGLDPVDPPPVNMLPMNGKD